MKKKKNQDGASLVSVAQGRNDKRKDDSDGDNDYSETRVSHGTCSMLFSLFGILMPKGERLF